MIMSRSYYVLFVTVLSLIVPLLLTIPSVWRLRKRRKYTTSRVKLIHSKRVNIFSIYFIHISSNSTIQLQIIDVFLGIRWREYSVNSMGICWIIYVSSLTHFYVYNNTFQYGVSTTSKSTWLSFHFKRVWDLTFLSGALSSNLLFDRDTGATETDMWVYIRSRVCNELVWTLCFWDDVLVISFFSRSIQQLRVVAE